MFLSYAREDADAARRLAEALRAFGLAVWFDQNELRGGDAWDTKIRTQIKTCALFVPIISQRTQERTEGYFRREWRIAVDRTHDMAGGVAFLVPVVIDHTPEGAAAVPEEFMRYQWMRLPAGEPTPDFVAQIKRLLETPRKAPPAGAALASAGVDTPGPAAARPAASRLRPAWTWAAGAALLVAVVAGLLTRWRAEPPAAPATTAPARTRAPAASSAPLDFATAKSIAVLPFANMSEESDSAFFADGMHEDVLTNLALVRELRVVSRTSVMPYRTTTKPMKQIAQELGVTYILEGSVRRVGNKVRVTGQLIHAATDEHVWAASYDRELTDIFTIQAELSRQIAGALKTALSPEEQILIARRPTDNPAAYDFFLRAREVSNREGNTVAAKARRIALLQGAVNLDPAFAQAWGELAAACAFSYFGNDEGRDDYLARAKAAIARAVQLAPDDPEVISSLGTYYYYGYRDYDRANEHYERLARLQPNSAGVFSSLGLIQRRQGRWAQSLVNTRRAADLDPANISYQRNLLASLTAGRRWDEAMAVQRRIAALLPDNLTEAYAAAGLTFYARGSTREGDEFFARLDPARSASPLGLNLRQDWARTKGDYAEAARLDRLQPYFDDDGDPHWRQAYFAAFDRWRMGDRDGAKARLENFPAELRAQVAREPDNPATWTFLGGMELMSGNNAAGLRAIARAAELLPVARDAIDGASYANVQALFHDLAGDKDRALAEYQRQMGIPSTLTLLNVHVLRHASPSLRGDPRFEALLADPKNNQPLF